MNPQEFAQKIKAKYPEYAKVDDVELAQKVVEKYPQYKGQVSFDVVERAPVEASKPSLGKFGEVSRDVSTGVAKGLVETGSNVLGMAQGLGQRVLAAVDPTRNLDEVRAQTGFKTLEKGTPEAARLESVVEADGTGEKVGKGIEAIAEFLVPSGAIARGTKVATEAIGGTSKLSKAARLATRSGIEAGTAGAIATAQEGEIGDNAKTAAIIGALFPIAGAATKALGGGIKSVGEKIQSSVIKPSVRDVKDGFKVENLGKYNLGGSLDQTLAKTNAEMNRISGELKSRLRNSKVAVNLNDVLNDTVSSLTSNKKASFGDNSSISRIVESLKSEVADVGGRNGIVDLLEANVIKRGAGTKGSWVFGMADPDSRATERVYTEFYNKLKVAIEDAAEASDQGGIKELNKQLSELIPINNAVLRRIPVEERNNALSLTDIISITGSFLDPSALALTGVNRLSKSGKVGELLQRAGESIKNPEARSSLSKRFFGN